MSDEIIVTPSTPNVIVVTPGSTNSQGDLIVGTGQGGAVGPAGPTGATGPAPILTSAVATGPSIGFGEKTFQVASGLSINVGQYVRISAAVTQTRYMAGYIISYSGTELKVGVQETAGTGTLGAAILSITGVKGATGATGNDGPTGPAGPAGGTYDYVQGTPAAVWTIVHNLGYRPQVSVVDSANSIVEGDYSYPDSNTMVLTFSSAFSGVAYLS